MKLKKTLALLLAVAMMISALGMTAFATEDADATEYWSGEVNTTWYTESDEDDVFIIDSADDLAGLAKLVDEGNTFEGKTVKLGADINLWGEDNAGERIKFNPIGHSSNGKSFNGTFDGQGYTISNLYQQNDLGAWQYEGEYYGLFAYTNGAFIQNLTIDGAYVSSGRNEAAAVVGNANNTKFFNITVSNSTMIVYNNSGAAVASECYGDCSFENIVVTEDTVVGPLWGTYDARCGGVVGLVHAGNNVSFKNVTVACKIDGINDVAANYQYWLYRYCGMLIGNVDGVNGVADPTGYVTCENVTVTIGEWANYHYCEFASLGAGSYNGPGEYKYARVEAGTGTDGIDLSTCNHAEDESHNVLIPFNQLFGGGQGVSGLAKYEGVEVYSGYYVAEVWAPETVARSTGYVLVDSYETLKDALAAAEEGYVVKLVKDIELSETMTVSENITLDLNGCTITGKDNAQSGSFVLFKVSKDAAFTVDDSVGSGVITLEAVNNRGWGGASSIISNEGGTLTIEGGRLEHLGGSDMAYAIDNNSTLGETTLTVNDGTIISPYRAIRAFQNSRTEMNTININGGEISARVGIWMQQPGASASFGTLNIAGGEFDCYSNAVVTDICGAGDTVVNISGGEFKNENANANLLLVWPLTDLASAQNAKAKMNITGGTFECAGEGKLFGFLDENDNTLKNAADMVDVSGGAFNQTFDETYLAEDFIISVDEYGYHTPVADNSGSDENTSTPVATKVNAALVPVDGNPNKYDIVLTANENAEIHRFLSAELNIKFIDETPLSIKNIVGNAEYGVEVINPKYNESGVWGFHLDDKAIEATGASLTIATVELMGYGKGQLILAPHDNNKVEAVESVEGNIVKEYLPENTEDAILEIDRTVHDVELLVPTKDLRIEITFPNPIEDSVAAYQDMTVTVDGADIDAIVTELGSDNGYLINEKQYVIVIEDALTENNSYNITVEGAGYRTADYRVTMTEDKTVYFWNNLVKGDPIAFEEGGTVKANASFLAGDIAEDNIIDKYDLAAVVSYFGKYDLKDDEATYKYAKYDLNRDGKIDSEDIAYVLVSFGY